jgi:predicted dehydrogenase
MKTIKYGIIGCGMMGQEHLRNIALLSDVEASVIYEPDAGMCAAAADLAPMATFADSELDVLNTPDIDCLLVVSPNHEHLRQLECALDAPHRPILMEKPLFTQQDGEDRIMRFQSQYTAPVWVAMEYRYMPPVAALIDKLDASTGGTQMLTIREHRFPFLEKVGDWNRFNENSGGTFVEKCCHFFDLMRLILKSDPVRVMASGGQAVNHLNETYDGQVPDIWDHGYVIVDFASGARAMLELCMFAEGAEFQEHIIATGPDGVIESLVPGPERFWPTDTLGPSPTPKLIVSPRHPKGPIEKEIPVDPTILAAGDHNGSTFYQHQKFVDMVRSGGYPEVSLTDGMWAVRMGQAAQQSARTGQVVNL